MKLSTVFSFLTKSKKKNLNQWGRILLAPISLCFLQCEIKQIVRTAISRFYVQNKNCGYFQQKQCELNVKKGENSKSTALCFVNQSEFVSDPKKVFDRMSKLVLSILRVQTIQKNIYPCACEKSFLVKPKFAQKPTFAIMLIMFIMLNLHFQHLL